MTVRICLLIALAAAVTLTVRDLPNDGAPDWRGRFASLLARNATAAFFIGGAVGLILQGALK